MLNCSCRGWRRKRARIACLYSLLRMTRWGANRSPSGGEIHRPEPSNCELRNHAACANFCFCNSSAWMSALTAMNSASIASRNRSTGGSSPLASTSSGSLLRANAGQLETVAAIWADSKWCWSTNALVSARERMQPALPWIQEWRAMPNPPRWSGRERSMLI